jgi:hypothetical protein
VENSKPEYVIVGANVWARGSTQDEAKQEFQRTGGRLSRGYVITYFDGVNSKFDYVDPINGAIWYFGDEPVEIARRKGRA